MALHGERDLGGDGVVVVVEDDAMSPPSDVLDDDYVVSPPSDDLVSVKVTLAVTYSYRVG
ncbi:hypothetical protein JYU34_019759 [Plutella xylostella]|uniref:Uncharacterized protein n=1 Tax=Plutella xylostella TaxID=51655 RepID=A0ABQ7PWS1_PLUXY|nr:hypothetical protein JYU34_019759 [Plutella xylostella]